MAAMQMSVGGGSTKKKTPYYGTASVWSAPRAATKKLASAGYSTKTTGLKTTTYYPSTSVSSNRLPSPSVSSGPTQAQLYAQAQARAAAAAAAKKKAADKKAADATKRSVDALHGQLAALDKSKKQAIANIDKRLADGRALIDKAFNTLSGQLQVNLRDNEKSEHDQTYHNLANRGRERADMLQQAASQGAGETDNLRVQAMALRNWANNQLEVNRVFHDTQTNVNSEIKSLNMNTKQNMQNLYGQANVDRTSVYDDFYKGQADVWNQIFNIENSMHDNDQYKTQYGDAAKKAQTALGSKFKDPGAPTEVKDWTGLATEEKLLNSGQWGLQDYSQGQELKKPEGASLRKW